MVPLYKELKKKLKRLGVSAETIKINARGGREEGEEGGGKQKHIF